MAKFSNLSLQENERVAEVAAPVGGAHAAPVGGADAAAVGGANAASIGGARAAADPAAVGGGIVLPPALVARTGYVRSCSPSCLIPGCRFLQKFPKCFKQCWTLLQKLTDFFSHRRTCAA